MKMNSNLRADRARAVAVRDPSVAAGGRRLLPGRGTSGCWHVLHAKSRQEKALAADLAAMGIAHYLPLVRRSRSHGQRGVHVTTPLFSGYMFLWGALDDAFRADRTRRVARLIHVSDQALLEWELRNIHRALEVDAPLDPHPALNDGVPVRVTAGPFAGLEGVVESARTDRLILQVAMLESAAGLEIDGSLLEPLA